MVDITLRIGKNWSDVIKEDIDRLIRNVIDQFGYNLGGESETTQDYKKSLKPFCFLKLIKTTSRYHILYIK